VLFKQGHLKSGTGEACGDKAADRASTDDDGIQQPQSLRPEK
jgi:hypothetical protein